MINVHLYPSQFLHESRILREARTLRRLRLFERIELVGTGGDGLAREEQVEEGIRIRRLAARTEPANLLRKTVDALRWSLAVWREYRKAPLACVNCHSVATLPLGCALKWATGARLVYDAHELETETGNLGGVRKAATKIVERMLIRYADYSIFVARSIDEWYRRSYGLANTAVVYNTPAFADVPRSNYFRETFGIAAGMPIFLYQGAISKDRGVPKLVDAFADLQQHAALVIMGYGELASWVSERSRSLSNVFYHEAVPPQRLLSYTGSADYGLSVIEPASLSYEYCMPNKLFEYLMAGKPVVVSPTSEQRSLVQRYGVGVVARDTSVVAVREAVVQLLAKDMGQLAQGIDRVRKEFCWEQQETVLRSIYLDSLAFRPLQREAA